MRSPPALVDDAHAQPAGRKAVGRCPMSSVRCRGAHLDDVDSVGLLDRPIDVPPLRQLVAPGAKQGTRPARCPRRDKHPRHRMEVLDKMDPTGAAHEALRTTTLE